MMRSPPSFPKLQYVLIFLIHEGNFFAANSLPLPFSFGGRQTSHHDQGPPQEDSSFSKFPARERGPSERELNALDKPNHPVLCVP